MKTTVIASIERVVTAIVKVILTFLNYLHTPNPGPTLPRGLPCAPGKRSSSTLVSNGSYRLKSEPPVDI